MALLLALVGLVLRTHAALARILVVKAQVVQHHARLHSPSLELAQGDLLQTQHSDLTEKLLRLHKVPLVGPRSRPASDVAPAMAELSPGTCSLPLSQVASELAEGTYC